MLTKLGLFAIFVFICISSCNAYECSNKLGIDEEVKRFDSSIASECSHKYLEIQTDRVLNSILETISKNAIGGYHNVIISRK